MEQSQNKKFTINCLNEQERNDCILKLESENFNSIDGRNCSFNIAPLILVDRSDRNYLTMMCLEDYVTNHVVSANNFIKNLRLYLYSEI